MADEEELASRSQPPETDGGGTMHIHKPKPLHGVREFLWEIAVIVIGVLIALSAEQIVQSFEWRDKIRRAHEEMGNEISADDGPQVLERLALTDCVEASLRTIRSEVESGASRTMVLHAIDRYGVPGHTWDSQAFDTARAEGVTMHGSWQDLAWWNLFFYAMPSLNQGAEREFDDGAALGAISRTGSPLGEEEKARIILAVETLSRDNRRMTAGATQAQFAMQKLHLMLEPHAVQRELGVLVQMPGAGACVATFKALVDANRTPLAAR
jgi:hypothetical protein